MQKSTFFSLQVYFEKHNQFTIATFLLIAFRLELKLSEGI